MARTKNIGILGGMGSYATLYAFRKILDKIDAKKEWDYPRVLIDNNSKLPSRVRAILYNENKEILLKGLNESIKNLVLSGAEIIIMPCNTVHYFFDYLKCPEEIYLTNILKITMNKIPKNSDCFLFASEGTIDSKIFERYNKNGININYPDNKTKKILRNIMEDVKQNSITEFTKKTYLNLISNYKENKFIVGCTEFSVLNEKCAKELKKIGKDMYDTLLLGIDYVLEKI